MRRDTGVLMIEDAYILFPNFKGAEGRYNKEGERSFSIRLDEEIAEMMRRDGWLVKPLRIREEGDPQRYQIHVSVEYNKGRPPQVVMITSKGRTDLGEDEIELLDYAEIDYVDVSIRPYHWNVNGDTGVKAYLRKIFVTLAEDELDRKYAHIPEIGAPSMTPEIEAPGTKIIQGSLVGYELEG